MPENESAQLKRIPYALDAEKAVLGACLKDRRVLDGVREKLETRDFYAPAHRLIYECICRLADADSPCDLVTVGEELRASGDLERVGGISYLSGLLDAVPAPSAAPAYAEIIADNSRQRAAKARGKARGIGHNAAPALVEARGDGLPGEAQHGNGANAGDDRLAHPFPYMYRPPLTARVCPVT